MKDLLPHYERELAALRAQAAAFAADYPRIAGRLQLSGDVGEDPHVERLIESFAFLSARVHKRLDDDFPLFTQALLDVVYPHCLRPFPSCAIARIGPARARDDQAKEPAAARRRVERGSLFASRPVRGTPCRFRASQAAELLPVTLTAAACRPPAAVAARGLLPRDTVAVLSVELALDTPEATWSTIAGQPLRLFLDGEASQVAALREALLGRALGLVWQAGPESAWQAAPGLLPAAVGFADEEALVDPDPRTPAALRLLIEYFAFPDKFNFVDWPLPEALTGCDSRRVSLHLALGPARGRNDDTRLLETIGREHLLTACVPVVNLFSQPADPIRLTHEQADYAVLPDARRPPAYEVHSIDEVCCVTQDANGETIRRFHPFFGLCHEDLLADGEDGARYWHVHRDEALAAQSAGHETRITVVDLDFDARQPQTDTLSLRVTATNRDLPTLLTPGLPGGDLAPEGGRQDLGEVRLLRRPTPSLRLPAGRGHLWRLISQLSLSHLSLAEQGLDALKEMLRLHDWPRSAANRRLLDALSAIEYRPASAFLPGKPYPALVRGTDIRLHVDEEGLVGSGLGLLAEVLDRLFALHAHVNSYTRLTLISAGTGAELITCPRRSGTIALV